MQSSDYWVYGPGWGKTTAIMPDDIKAAISRVRPWIDSFMNYFVFSTLSFVCGTVVNTEMLPEMTEDIRSTHAILIMADNLRSSENITNWKDVAVPVINISLAIFGIIVASSTAPAWLTAAAFILAAGSAGFSAINSVAFVESLIEVPSSLRYEVFNSSYIPKTYTLTGRVLESGSGLSGVSIRLTGAGKDTTATTSSTGAYAFTGLPTGAYTLTPAKTDYTFTPPNSQAIVSNANYTVPDITATKTTIQPITFVPIPGNTFQMGDEKGDLWSACRPVHTVTVSSFQMSEAEITNSQYCAYLNAALVSGDITATSSTVIGKKGLYSSQNYIYLSDSYDSNNKCWIRYSNTVFSVVSGYENWPVVFVTWYGSKAFAEYYGWDLARESEWEYACRGGKQYLYGTDDGTISKDKANYWNNGPNHPVNVKSYPKNPFGLYDMSGNVWEWCSDWYGSYSSSPATDPTGAQTGFHRVIRGGGWYGYVDYGCRSATRDFFNPIGGFDVIGLRVVSR